MLVAGLLLAAPALAEMPAEALRAPPQITFEELAGSGPFKRPYSPFALATGAAGGVLAYHGATTALLPSVAAGSALEAALAASRFYVVASAVGGALIGQWIYDRLAD